MTNAEYIKYIKGQQELLGPYSMLASTVSGIGSTMDNVSEQNAIQKAGRPDLANFVVGNTWGDIFNNSERVSQGLNIIDDNTVDYSNVGNNDNLLNTWNTNDLQNNVYYGGVNAGQVFGDTLGDMGKGAGIGATIGSIIPGVGTAIGAGVGALAGVASSIGRGFFGDVNNRNNAAKFNKAIERANKEQVDNFYNTASINNQRQLRQNMMNYFDNGGSLEGLNGVTTFNVGSTHENNPNGGIQQGIAPDGLPNTVEEGEVKYEDYIYSNRLKPSKKLLKDNNIPDKYHGLTYADLAKKLQKESEDRPNDPISKATLNEWMSRLANAQETQKAVLEKKKLAEVLNSMSDEEKAAIMYNLTQQQEDIDLSQPMYANGGKIYIAKNKRGTFTAAAKKHGKSVQAFASQVLANKENYSEVMRKKAQFAKNSKSWSHAEGGYLVGQTYDVSEEEYNRLISLGYEIERV